MPLRISLHLLWACSTLLISCSRDDICNTQNDHITRRLLELSDESRAGLSADVPPADFMTGLEKLCQGASKAVGHHTGKSAVDRLNDFLFNKSGFRREVKDPDIRFMLLPYVVRHKRGSCFGLASLYLVLARALHLPIKAVMVPGHVFVRLAENEPHVNIELFHKGEFMPDAWYRKKWKVPEHATSYMRELTDEQFISVLLFNMGNEYRTRKMMQKALDRYSASAHGFSDFAEAHASIGLVYQLQGRFQKAMDAYMQAKRLQPALRGLDGNIKKLRRLLGSSCLEKPAPCRDKAR